MPEACDKSFITPAEVVSGTPPWPKEERSWEHLARGNETVYEDNHVIVFHDPVDEDHESTRLPDEVRLTLLSKKHIHSLLDLGVADEYLNAKILNGIQQAAFKLGLEKKGFEVRAHVMPPLQTRPELAFKIRSGKPPKKGDAAAG
jgi:hypothetical protein